MFKIPQFLQKKYKTNLFIVILINFQQFFQQFFSKSITVHQNHHPPELFQIFNVFKLSDIHQKYIKNQNSMEIIKSLNEIQSTRSKIYTDFEIVFQDYLHDDITFMVYRQSVSEITKQFQACNLSMKSEIYDNEDLEKDHKDIIRLLQHHEEELLVTTAAYQLARKNDETEELERLKKSVDYLRQAVMECVEDFKNECL